MNTHAAVLALRLVHILSAIFWLGGLMIVNGFILPSLKVLGPKGEPMMTELVQVRKLPMRIFIAGWTAVLSGLALYFRFGSAGGSDWYASTPGRVFGFGGALGLLTIIMGSFFNLPMTKRMGAITASVQAAGGTPTAEQAAELQRLQGRLKRLTMAAVALLMLAAAAMSVARYW